MADQFRSDIPSADAGHTETKAIYAAVITVTILATIAVILRFLARRKSEASISYEYVLSDSIAPLLNEIISLETSNKSLCSQP